MREVWLVIVALVIGGAIGTLVPQSSVRALEDEVAMLEARECDPSPDLQQQLGRLLGAAEAVRDLPRPAPSDDPPPADVAPEQVVNDAVGEPPRPTMGFREGLATASEEELSTIRSSMEYRRKSARDALIDQAGVDESQLADIDEATVVLNDDLQSLARDFVADFGEGAEPSRRDMLGFSADALDIVIAAEDSFAAVLDPEQRAAAAQQASDPLQYIDPAILDIIQGLRPQ